MYINMGKIIMGVVREIIQWTVLIIIAIVISMLIRTFIFEPVKVEGSSMLNTLQSGERLILYKTGYLLHVPQRGDIIVLKYKDGMYQFLNLFNRIPFIRNMIEQSGFEEDYIKRIVGVPGDIVDIHDGSVYINGEKLEEEYANGITEQKTISLPIEIKEDQYFVLGDNRQNSKDSRIIGLVERQRIKGKVVFRIWPFKAIGKI